MSVSKYIKNLSYSIAIRIGMALSYADELIFKSINHAGSEKDKKIQRHRHRNNTLESFYAGKEDEKYTQEYYEILKEGDKFMRNATAHKMAAATDRHGMNYGKKDKWGRSYEHYGFFDEKSKNAGKTVGEVINNEYKERKTDDDDYEIVHIFNNTPIEIGFAKAVNIMTEIEDKFVLNDSVSMSKQLEFPIKCLRENDSVNKIEQLSEVLHVKIVGTELFRLEFFIPIKYKTSSLPDDSKILKEIIGIDQVFIKDTYGKLIGYNIQNFVKRIIIKDKNGDDTFEVYKFMAKEIGEVK
jgi:hypothetical protein